MELRQVDILGGVMRVEDRHADDQRVEPAGLSPSSTRAAETRRPVQRLHQLAVVASIGRHAPRTRSIGSGASPTTGR